MQTRMMAPARDHSDTASARPDIHNRRIPAALIV
jgi:hypothetical protein